MSRFNSHQLMIPNGLVGACFTGFEHVIKWNKQIYSKLDIYKYLTDKIVLAVFYVQP